MAARPHGGGGLDRRGNSKARRARKWWLLSAFGDGTTCPCAHCKRQLSFETLQADRIIPGATYRRHNVQPSCGPCNQARGNDLTWSYQPKELSHE